MAFKVEVSPEAKQDVRTAFDWYKERSAKAANAFRAEVLSVFDLIAQDPNCWGRTEESVHRFVMKRYPYTVYFEIGMTAIRILAVGHHRRLPGHWAGR